MKIYKSFSKNIYIIIYTIKNVLFPGNLEFLQKYFLVISLRLIFMYNLEITLSYT